MVGGLTHIVQRGWKTNHLLNSCYWIARTVATTRNQKSCAIHSSLAELVSLIWFAILRINVSWKAIKSSLLDHCRGCMFPFRVLPLITTTNGTITGLFGPAKHPLQGMAYLHFQCLTCTTVCVAMEIAPIIFDSAPDSTRTSVYIYIYDTA